MTRLFGRDLTRAELDALVPDIARLAGIRTLREENGPGAGQRLIRIESGGGLTVEILPDRTCDLGMVWCGGIPFGWAGPIGAGAPATMGANTPLSGMLTTCGFDHIRQPVMDEGRDYPQHGSMIHQPATVLRAAPVWEGDTCTFRVTAEATQFALDRGAVRLHRTIGVPLGGQTLSVCDEVTVLSRAIPLMAMYHLNFGYPLAGPESRLTFGGQDLTDPCLGTDGIRTRPSGHGPVTATLAAAAHEGAARVDVTWDADHLPVFQTLRNAAPGINLTCLEPATHDRQTRAELRVRGLLDPAPAGTQLRFRLDFSFHPGLGG